MPSHVIPNVLTPDTAAILVAPPPYSTGAPFWARNKVFQIQSPKVKEGLAICYTRYNGTTKQKH